MQEYPFSIVDVFAERPLAGNQLAVVHNAADLSDAQMQAIALETNYSETTFVLARSPGRAKVRIFTPVFELPFAGHPVIGTAWELTEGQEGIVLELPVGDVGVMFDQGIGWMTPPPVVLGDEFDRTKAAQLVGLDASQLDSNMPVQLAQVGPDFVLIPVADLAALKTVRLNADLHTALLAQGHPVQSVFVFTSQAYGPDADYASRMFVALPGVREDPATGSANTAFAAYLRHHKGLLGEVVVDQGVEINRPSRLYLRVAQTIEVGGKVHRFAGGTLSL